MMQRDNNDYDEMRWVFLSYNSINVRYSNIFSSCNSNSTSKTQTIQLRVLQPESQPMPNLILPALEPDDSEQKKTDQNNLINDNSSQLNVNQWCPFQIVANNSNTFYFQEAAARMCAIMLKRSCVAFSTEAIAKLVKL